MSLSSNPTTQLYSVTVCPPAICLNDDAVGGSSVHCLYRTSSTCTTSSTSTAPGNSATSAIVETIDITQATFAEPVIRPHYDCDLGGFWQDALLHQIHQSRSTGTSASRRPLVLSKLLTSAKRALRRAANSAIRTFTCCISTGPLEY